MEEAVYCLCRGVSSTDDDAVQHLLSETCNRFAVEVCYLMVALTPHVNGLWRIALYLPLVADMATVYASSSWNCFGVIFVGEVS